ncbi:heavy-metal-associated domain-containing protein [Bordetella sp. BOR01]|uniref:heavy-metal-associated domain-containing protein n=1 Tax=Bordetella sp. BOR01 TaxID=2854779 RepID=UPI001C45271A|nr:heavy-metal-associated domain-containing protein [Bordetella sp. BOR01]MBV7485940.1 heavy-metal-associated domain-containing protein [Bordetella sp. BOR01]
MSIQFSVPDMSCGHCVSTITQAVQQAVPGARVTADLSARRVTVENASEADVVRAAIVQAGYDAQPVA